MIGNKIWEEMKKYLAANSWVYNLTVIILSHGLQGQRSQAVADFSLRSR